MKIYIAGKITGYDGYKEHFKAAEKHLQGLGHVVMNPAVLPAGFEWDEYMHVCFAMIDVCDAVYMLNNWGESKGARMEYDRAKWLVMKIMYEGEGLE